MDDYKTLVNKQVNCYIASKDGKPVLDTDALAFIQFMYPNFKVVKTEFDIYADEPFIYIGDTKYINKIKQHPEDKIIVATTGELDLTSKEVLLKLVYAHHNKEPYKYVLEMYELWSKQEFFYNLKFIWLLGTITSTELKKNDLFFKILDNLSKPIDLMKLYYNALDELGEDEATKYIEKSLVNFILACDNMNAQNTKNKMMLQKRDSFKGNCAKNTSFATNNLIDTPIDNQNLRMINYLLDLMLGDVAHGR